MNKPINKLMLLGYRMASLLIFSGVILLCQPFDVAYYSYGFPVLLSGVILFIILDHLPQSASRD